MKQNTRMLAFLCALFFLQLGCSTIRINPKATETAPVVKELVKSSRSWDATLLPAYPQGQPEITILRISIPAGARLNTHTHPVINAGVLISGELTVMTMSGETLHLKAGDPIIELVNTLHYGINEGSIPAEIIVFYAGVLDQPITVSETR